MTYQQKSGFTLVELAIVITIIGILIGGVLKGQQLIEQARLAATISQVNNYHTAFSIFRTTYNELPGDMRDPDARIVGCNGCKAEVYTQGDGIIGSGDLWGSAFGKDTENVNFWLHLMKAGMITGVTDAALTAEPVGLGTTHPAAKIKGGFVVDTGAGRCASADQFVIWGGCQAYGHVIFLHNRINEQGTFRYGGSEYIMSPLQAASIDQKMDDGKPLTGEVRGAGRGNIQGCANDDEAYPEAETDADRCSLGFIIGE